jgi:Glycoside hydrolase family 127 C-terminal domain
MTRGPAVPSTGALAPLDLDAVRLDPTGSLRTTGHVINSTSAPLSGPDGGTFRGGEVAVAAVPYFTWGNRGGGPMRVWIPVSR